MCLTKIRFIRVTKSMVLSLAAIVTIAVSTSAGQFTVFHIGNSLTQDLYKYFGNVGTRYEATLGNSYYFGYIMKGSTVLPYFYTHPNDYQAALPGPWPEALPGRHWDVVTMQPHPGTGQGSNYLIDNIVAVNGIIASAQQNDSNASTRFYIYGAWSDVSLTDTNLFSRTYTSATINKSNPNNTSASACRDFTELLCDSVRKTNPHVCVIPVGEVLYTLDQKMQHGEFDSFTTIKQVHRDVIHMNSVGQNIAAWTAYATIFQKSPVGLQVDISGNGCAKGFTNEQFINAHDLLLMQKTIWDVVTAMHKYTTDSLDPPTTRLP